MKKLFKRVSPLFCAAVIAFALAACSEPKMQLPAVPTPTPTAPMVEVPPKADYSGYDLISKIDGSTATIPLSEAALLNRAGTYEGLNHSKTHWAYERLINGESDIIFVTYPSEEEFALAKQSNVILEIVPVVKDALVFLCNTANPVQTLTSQQIKDIYTDRVTDWSEVGGKKSPITAFQRPVNSGSQTLFLKLAMEGETPSNPPLGLRPAEMGNLIDAVADYDYAESSIGYSVFYYVSDMYGSPDVRLMAVDGVLPTRETIAADTYPYITYYYAVLRRDTPKDHPVREYLSWMLSDDGQYVARDAGYVPLRILPQRLDSSGYGFFGSTPENTSQSSGTGGTEYRLNETEMDKWYDSDLLNGDRTFNGNGLAEFPELERAVNEWRGAELSAMGNVSDVQMVCNPYYNLLNVTLSAIEKKESKQLETRAVFDITTGKRLKLSDLFYNDVNYIEYINREMKNTFSNNYSMYMGYEISSFDEDVIKRPFTGLPNDYSNFEMTVDDSLSVRLILNENPFFQVTPGYQRFYFHNLPLPLDMSPWGSLYKLDYDRENIADNLDILIPRVQTCQKPTEIDDKINNELRALAERAKNENTIDRTWMKEYPDEKFLYMPSISVWEDNISVGYSARFTSMDSGFVTSGFRVMLNLRTGERVDAKKHMPSDWRDYVAIAYLDGDTSRVNDYTPPENVKIEEFWITQWRTYAAVNGDDGELIWMIVDICR